MKSYVLSALILTLNVSCNSGDSKIVEPESSVKRTSKESSEEIEDWFLEKTYHLSNYANFAELREAIAGDICSEYETGTILLIADFGKVGAQYVCSNGYIGCFTENNVVKFTANSNNLALALESNYNNNGVNPKLCESPQKCAIFLVFNDSTAISAVARTLHDINNGYKTFLDLALKRANNNGVKNYSLSDAKKDMPLNIFLWEDGLK